MQTGRINLDKQEQVLCIPREIVMAAGPWPGWRDFDWSLWNTASRCPTLRYRTPDLEYDTSVVQVVVYGMVSYLDDDGNKLTLVYKRGRAGSEQRLHSKLTIGVGGHVNRTDAVYGNDTVVRSGMRRELKEELGLTPRNPQSMEEVGILFDDRAEGVNAVHLGLVFDITVFQHDINPEKVEQACEPIGWMTHDQIRDMYVHDPSRWEDWSRWVIVGALMAEEVSTKGTT